MKNETVEKRQEAEKKLLLEQLRRTPIIKVACEKINIGHSTYYRWRKEDEGFSLEADEAISAGEQLINDLSESQLVSLIKDKNFPAINLWLRQHHPKYSNRLEVTARIKSDDVMTPEQEKIVREALGLVGEQASDKQSNAQS
ncbi:MAG: hypothetical protein UR72_C0003G0039 [Parcubacteria group bacterium GW2011_GWC1_35_21]|uniref:Homeodomain phBC6A51-type domain-containing protein n=1 Tax=Candidatus Nomurabacteria bacterium GW2011_GWA1_36_15 TaxID=1618728 RepID=A0A0G0DTW4_9BACT|nr:MAG: hypothetical protein UR72_C0003G0039 [Parcubacteria group bacterium GW2011_GWC1_35_21]KKP97999.1 MAG: hypothetical protein US05_C0009G0016 [Candidatus Nomurabacteria bacterium GW2011_GWA1_36_15]